MQYSIYSILILAVLTWNPAAAYGSIIINKLRPAVNRAQIARTLVHQTNWASVGTISTNDKILGYPMVNVISIDDSDVSGASTGKIRFMLMDLDFTGQDWRQNNKVTFMFSDEQNLNCQKKDADPMDHSCPRAMLSGKVIEMVKNSPEYNDALTAFKKRHPAADTWLQSHYFYLCELKIENIFVFAQYGSRNVDVNDYYNTDPKKVVVN